VYVSAGKKGRERDRESRSHGLSTRGRGSYSSDKPPIFIIADRGTGQRYVIPSKTADESTIRLLLARPAGVTHRLYRRLSSVRTARRRQHLREPRVAGDGGSRPTEESPKTS
jgi:hypothetical protein